MQYLKSKFEYATYIIPLIILSLSLFLFHQYFISGIYKWHIAQLGNQISIVYALSVIAGAFLLKPGKLQYFILIGLILLYTLFTGIIGSLVIVAYYSLGFYLLGIKYYKSGLAIQLSYGVIFFILLRSVLSIISSNLILIEVLSLVAVLIAYCASIKPRESLVNIFSANIPFNSRVVFVVISVITIGLNIATENYSHDSLWYPLRSNALYFQNNFFADNGFYGIVHYYPKLWESLTNNIFIEYNYSYGVSLSASLYMVLVAIVYSLFERNKIINTLITITTPVVVGLSFSIKVDLLLLVLILMGFKAIEARRYDLVASAVLLALCVKNSAIIFVFALLTYVYIKHKENISGKEYKEANKSSYIIVLLSFLVFSLFILRTYQLTGVLIASPNLLVKVQEMFGFEYGLPRWIVASGTLDGFINLYKVIIYPEALGHHRMYYIGYLWAASVFVLDEFVAVLLLLFLLVAYSVPGLGTGYYFSGLTVLLTIIVLRKIEIERVGLLIIILNIFISIVANPNWVIPKVPSIKNVCYTVICSDENYLSKDVSYHKMSVLRNIINDKSKMYFVVSKDKGAIIWKLFHKYNVAHLHEFRVWNQIVPMYTLQDYLNKHIDVLIVENDFGFKVDISKFEKFKIGDKYSYYSKICATKLKDDKID